MTVDSDKSGTPTADKDRHRHSGPGGQADMGGKEVEEVPFTEVLIGSKVDETGDPITRHRQSMQKVIVFAVVGLLLLTVLAPVLRWLFYPDTDLTKYASTLLAPVLGVSGTVIGFYFSGKGTDG